MAKSSGGTRGSSWRDKPQSIESVLNRITESGFYDSYKGSLELDSRGRTMQGYIASLMGRDGNPKLVSQAEFDKIAQQVGNVVIYRGFRRDEDANIANFKNGKAYDGSGGKGEGLYFSTQKLSQFSASGKFVEGILNTHTAKVGSYEKLESQWLKERKDFKSKPRPNGIDRDDYNMRKEAYNDFGRWATLKGYDAYTTSEYGGTEYIILNRSKLIVKK